MVLDGGWQGGDNNSNRLFSKTWKTCVFLRHLKAKGKELVKRYV